MKGWVERGNKVCVGKILETVYSTLYRGVVYLPYLLYFKISCVYCCSYLVFIVVVVLCIVVAALCVLLLVVLCVLL